MVQSAISAAPATTHFARRLCPPSCRSRLALMGAGSRRMGAALAGRGRGDPGAVRAFGALVPEWRRGPVRTPWRRWCASGCSRSPVGTRTRTTPTPYGRIRCSSWSVAACRRAGPTWPASRPSPGWRMPRTGQRATAWRGPCWPSTCRSGSARASPGGSCWTSTGRTIRPTGTRRARRTMATIASTCTTRCWSSTARPTTSSRRCSGRATPTRAAGRWPSCGSSTRYASAGRACGSNCGRTVASPSPRSMTTATRKASPTRSA